MSDLLRRFRYPLAYLLLGALCMLGMASDRGPVPLGLASRLVLSLTLPLQRAVTLPVDHARSWWGDLVELARVRVENADLRQQVARLEEENLQYREAIVSSERYQRLRGFVSNREVPMVPANVVHQDLSPWFQSVIIDQGATAGIRPGMPVVTDSGVVGVVSGTAPSASKVLLLIDPQSRVDSYVQRSRARGSVRGSSMRGAELEHLLREEDVQVGDQLLTSGLDSVYPKGLMIGRIAALERRPYGLFQIARVTPAVDFRKLEEVFVILERRDLPADDAFANADERLWEAPAPEPTP